MQKMFKNCSILVLISCLMLLAFVQSQPTGTGDQIFKRCLELHNITQAEFEVKQKMHSSEEDEVEPKFKCFVHCILEETELFDSEGLLDADKFAKAHSLGDAERDTILECKDTHDVIEDKCDYAVTILHCIYDNLEADYDAEQETEEEEDAA